MPPTKYAYRTTSQHEFAELRREVKRIGIVVNTMTEKVDLLIAAADRFTIATAALTEALERTRENAHVPLVGGDAAAPTFNDVVILPRPSTIISLNGTEKRRRVTITKALIIAVLIKPFRKDETGGELPDTKLNAIYSNISDLRKAAIATTIRELGYCICKPQVKQCLCGAAAKTPDSPNLVRWGELNSRDRNRMVVSFETSILEKERIPIHKCENHWAGAHILEEAWSNWTRRRH